MTRPLVRVITLLLFCSVLSASPSGPSQADDTTFSPNVARARAILTEGLESSDFVVRIQAITAASMVGGNETMVARLEDCLKDKNVQVRLAAIHALVDLKSPKSERGCARRSRKTVLPKSCLPLRKPLPDWKIQRERWLSWMFMTGSAKRDRAFSSRRNGASSRSSILLNLP